MAASVAVAVPAGATVTTFAQYTQVSGARTLDWVQIGNTGGRLCTISTATGSCPTTLTGASTQSVAVKFTFLQDGIASTIDARLTLDLVAQLGNPVTATAIPRAGTMLVQTGLSGTFSIIADSPFTYGSVTGSNLLSGVLGDASISGFRNSSSGSVNGSTLDAATVTYSSDFLTFTNTVDRDFALTLTAINPTLGSTTGKSLNNFRAASTGSFSSDPAPLVNGVPEAATWSMMLIGFGMAGSALRKRRQVFAA